jgi:hypothetical protein
LLAPSRDHANFDDHANFLELGWLRRDSSIDSLGAAGNTAVKLGAVAVSNSYGTDECNGVIADGKKYFAHPGVAIVASSGDNGFQAASFPARPAHHLGEDNGDYLCTGVKGCDAPTGLGSPRGLGAL